MAEAAAASGGLAAEGRYDEGAAAFKPFERKDYYGRMGTQIAASAEGGDRGAWRWLAEALRLAVAGVTLLPVRLVLVFVCVISYYAVCSAAMLSSSFTGGVTRIWWIRQSGVVHARLLLYVLGFFTIDVVGGEGSTFAYDDDAGRVVRRPSPPEARQEHGEGGERRALLRGAPAGAGAGAGVSSTNIVSNHISWLDIPVHMVVSACPAFVSKRSVRRAPIVGSIAEQMGCLFVERETGPDAAAAAAQGAQGAAAPPRAAGTGASALVRERMLSNAEAGRRREEEPAGSNTSLVVFPEGTTTNGRFLLPFHRSSFIASVPLRMVILEYRSARLSLAWDSIPALRHFLLLCCQPVNHVRVSVVGCYVPGDSERGAAGVASCAARVRAIMAENGGLALSNSSLKEKRLYHKLLLGSGAP